MTHIGHGLRLMARHASARLGRSLLVVPVALAIGGAGTSPDVQVGKLAAETGFEGAVLISKGEKILLRKAYGRAVPKELFELLASKLPATSPPDAFDLRNTWRWASVTKQVTAVLVMQEVEAGRIDLDLPISRYLPNFASPNASTATVRQLLKHQAGLPNPDDTAADAASPSDFYSKGYPGSRDPLTGYCAGKPQAAPGGNWQYNNCDYIVAGALLEAVTGKPWPQLVQDRIAKPLKLRSLDAYPRTGTLHMMFEQDEANRVQPERAIDMAAFEASGGLFGSINDLWTFDRALMTGKLLGPKALAELWDSSPQQGFIALGQWVYAVPIKGCAEPLRIVERRGSIGGASVRNFILPDKDMVVIAFTNRGGFEDDFGEPWQGKGLSHDLLAAAACQ